MARKSLRNNLGFTADTQLDTMTFENFQGVDIINDNTNLPKKLVPYAKNCDFSKEIGAATKRDGVKKLFDSLGTGGCTGIHNYRSSAGDRVLFGWGNTLYKLAGTADSISKKEQADWQAGQSFNLDLTSSPGDIKLAANIPAHTFSRSSEAYRKDGVTVAADSPRYEQGVFGNGIFIEEGTTNYINNPLFATDLSGWNQASYANWAHTDQNLAVRQTTGGAVGSTFVQLGNGVDDGNGMAIASDIAVSTGWEYNLSYYMKVADIASKCIVLIRVKDTAGTNISSSVTPFSGWVYSAVFDALYTVVTNKETGKWERHVHYHYAPPNAAKHQIAIMYYEGGDKHVSISAVQLENKTNASSFTVGWRTEEALYYTIPELPPEFLASGILKPEWAHTATNISTYYPAMIGLKKDGSDDIYVLQFDTHWNDGEWKGRFFFRKKAGATEIHLFADPTPFNAGDTIRWAIAQLTTAYNDLPAGMHLWIKVNNGAVRHTTYPDIVTVSGVTKCHIGQVEGLNVIDATVDNIFVENVAARNAVGQIVNSHGIEDILKSESAYSQNAATILHVSGDNTLVAPRNPGAWLSQVLDLGSTPELASITWTATEPDNTDVSLKIRSSDDGLLFGTWQTIPNNGSIPLQRYQQIRVDENATDSSTPVFSDLTINYESSLNQALTINTGLSGTKIRFTNYDNKCYWCAGGRIQVYDGSSNRDVGVDPPAAAPTIAAGTGTGLTGKYKACVTFVDVDGKESNPSPYSSEIDISNKNINWSNIPTGGARVVKRNLYRTKAGGVDYYCAPGMGDIYRVKVPNGEGSSNR
jgi:hypothetical protein